jgi:glycosyltransferase involved in cell wall biosynthesis
VKEHVIGSRRLAAGVSVIPNGVDCDHFGPTPRERTAARERLALPPEAFVLGTIANIRPVKNYPFLLHAMKRIVDECPRARLLWVGGGSHLRRAQALACELGIADRVIFAGLVKDVRPFLAAMDAFALCSSKEGNPNVVLQAMAMSVPVIAAAVGEVPYLLQEGAGLPFAAGDETAFRSAVARLAGDETLRKSIGTAGRCLAERTYSSAEMVAGYAALLREAAASARPSRSGGGNASVHVLEQR